MGYVFGDLLDGEDWYPLVGTGVPSNDGRLSVQTNPHWFWHDGRLLADAPVDFAATFGGNMWKTGKPVEHPVFNRNPLRCAPGFMVPRHHHNWNELIVVFGGEFFIESGDEARHVRAGESFMTYAGTPYTMTTGPEGVVYIETWPEPVRGLYTYWHDVGWVHR